MNIKRREKSKEGLPHWFYYQQLSKRISDIITKESEIYLLPSFSFSLYIIEQGYK
jgi:hypothetical protein